VGRLIARSARKLSRAALETLAIVAYRQPVTQPEIEVVRGVQVSGVLDTLLDRGLIREQGRKVAIGRPILYATTPEFLHYFALKDLAELPALEAEEPP
jgi:segregation and condensation protein B